MFIKDSISNQIDELIFPAGGCHLIIECFRENLWGVRHFMNNNKIK
jgi:hypothetical protein